MAVEHDTPAGTKPTGYAQPKLSDVLRTRMQFDLETWDVCIQIRRQGGNGAGLAIRIRRWRGDQG